MGGEVFKYYEGYAKMLIANHHGATVPCRITILENHCLLDLQCTFGESV